LYQKEYPPHEEGLSGYDFFLKMGFSVEHYIGKFTMAKCSRCNVSLGLISFRDYCPACEESIKNEERIRSTRIAEKEKAERQQAALDIAKSIKKQLVAGKQVTLYDSIYLDVDSRVVDNDICKHFHLGLLHKLGIEGWEVIGVIPRTIGIALTNTTTGTNSCGTTWGAGVGGNVVGVYVLIKFTATSTNCSDKMLLDHVRQHVLTTSGYPYNAQPLAKSVGNSYSSPQFLNVGNE
jgi:hypothetical protein